jgi:hypothetical protein
MQPKSKRRVYVSFEDRSNSVLYYNAETHKILKSRNYHFLTIPQQSSPPEEIEVAPDSPCEGERFKDNTRLSGQPSTPGTGDKRKQDNEEFEPRKTRGIRPDYHYLQNPFPRHLHIPFPDEEETHESILTESDDQQYAIIAGDRLTNLKDAKQSPDWPDWECAIQAELDQLQQMGTWKLVDKPKGAVPISNKWVFIKKRNRLGEIMKYKARLVAKGCAQRPGHDYVETFSPVVRMETIRAILSLVPVKGLKIQQMDIKGAYLNGIL